MLACDPAQRYQSAALALADLEALGEPKAKSLMNHNEPSWPLPGIHVETVPLWGTADSMRDTQPVGLRLP